MDYTLFYDLIDARHPVWTVAEQLGPLAATSFVIGVLMIVAPRFAGSFGSSRWPVPTGLLLIILPTAMLILCAVAVNRQYDSLELAIAAGRYSMAEGPISDLKLDETVGPSIKGGSFVVDGVPFRYKPQLFAVGFYYRRSDEDVIRNGRNVRIRYVGKTIVRLEVAS